MYAVLGEVCGVQIPRACVVQDWRRHPERAPELPGPGQPCWRQEHLGNFGYPGAVHLPVLQHFVHLLCQTLCIMLLMAHNS